MDIAHEDFPMIDPVMILELDPCGRQQIEERHFFHLALAGQQAATDFARVWCHQPLAGFWMNRRHTHVAKEPRPRRAFFGVIQIIPTAICGSKMGNALWRLLTRLLESSQRTRLDRYS